MPDLKEMTDEQLADAPGMPGSIDSHLREMEFRRRELRLARDTATAQIRAAKWTTISAIIIGVSVFVSAVGLWLQYSFS